MVEILEYQLPADATEPTWQGLSALICADVRDNFGAYGPEHTPSELLAQARNSAAAVRRWLAVAEEQVLGFARCVMNHPDNPDGVDAYVWVSPEHRRQGIGRCLAAALLAEIDDTSHVTARLFTKEVGTAGLAGPGGGFVDAGHPGVRLALGIGMELGVVYLLGRYDLRDPGVPLEAVLSRAREHLRPEWVTHSFEGPPPEKFQQAIAVAKNQTLVDAPQGNIAYTGDGWDAERVATHYGRLAAGDRVFFTLVLDADGGVVALTELSSPRQRPAAMAQQFFTVVMPEHRGHRLGLWTKATNLVSLVRAVPECPGVVAMNAAANRHMLAVNRELGFCTTKAVGIFQRPGGTAVAAP